MNRARALHWIGALMFSLVLAAYTGEIVLALRPNRTPIAAWRARRNAAAEAAGRPVDTRTPIAVLDSLRALGEAYPAVAARRLRRRGMPLGNPLNTTVRYCNEDGQYIVFRSDERGHRNPPGLWTGSLDVVVIGDSYVQGNCVAASATIAARIRERYPRTAALGIDGAGPLFGLALLREYAAPHRPRWVVWVFTEANDLSNLTREATEGLDAYLDPAHSRGILARLPALDSLLRAHLDSALAHPPVPVRWRPSRWSRIRATLTLYRTREAVRRALGLPAEGDESCCDPELLHRTARAWQQAVESWGGHLVAVYLTTPRRSPERRARRAALAALRSAGVEVLVPDSRADSLYLFPGAHLNAAGYRVVAKEVLGHLKD